MKKLMMLLGLLIGVSSVGVSQTSWKQGVENKISKKKNQPRKQMWHFDKPKRDPAIKFNGTSASAAHQPSRYNVDKKSFKSPKYFTDSKQTKGKRSRNKNFNTYTYK